MLRKFALISLATLGLSLQLAAQPKIVTSDYNRNSLSFVAVQRGDSRDGAVAHAVEFFSPGAKFDINDIRTNNIRIRKSRDESIYESEISESVNAVPFGKEILASIFNRDSNGMMNEKTVLYRGNYDAKDQDVINARAARVGEESLGDMGYSLVKNSYIVVTDFYNFESNTNKDGKVTWTANARGFAYRIGIDDAMLNDFFETCWIYDEDNRATRDAKLRAFDNLEVPMEFVASSVSGGSGSTVEGAALSCLSGLITGLENVIPEWEVAVGVVSTKPLRAKIGTKEGLTNGARYRAYSYTENRDGQLKSVPRGFLRATTISDNMSISTGQTEPSEFYQISGLTNIEEGWTIKQSNDVKIGVAPGLRAGAPGGSAFAIDADWLMEVKTGGSMQYVLFTMAFPFGESNYIPMLITAGYGYAIHLTRMFEIMPYFQLGADGIFGSHEVSSGDRDTWKNLALVLEPGARVAVNVAYPLQVYAKAYADVIPSFIQGYRYKMYNQYLNHPHNGGVGVQFGIKWTF